MLNIVTGAFGFSGKYITQLLLNKGQEVRTLTGHPAARADPLWKRVEVAPLSFDDPAKLAQSMVGASTLYNTYWVRFGYGKATFDNAVRNTLALFGTAKQAGVNRIVHVSITNPSLDSPFPYFRGKAILEKALAETGLSYAILRPAVIFGHEGILLNNIGWLLRRFPVFPIAGDGRYKLHPIFVEDMANLAVNVGLQSNSFTTDAVGPETYTYEAIVRLIAEAIGRKPRLVHCPPGLVLMLSKMLGILVRDVVLTRDEIEGLMAGLLVSKEPPTGKTRLSQWLKENADTVGRRYLSELDKHYK